MNEAMLVQDLLSVEDDFLSFVMQTKPYSYHASRVPALYQAWCGMLEAGIARAKQSPEVVGLEDIFTQKLYYANKLYRIWRNK